MEVRRFWEELRPGCGKRFRNGRIHDLSHLESVFSNSITDVPMNALEIAVFVGPILGRVRPCLDLWATGLYAGGSRSGDVE